MPEEKTQQEKRDDDEAQPIPIKIKRQQTPEPIRVTDKRFWVQPQEGAEEGGKEFSLKPTYVEELEKKLADSQKKTEEIIASYRTLKAESATEIQQARGRIQAEYDRRMEQAKANSVEKFIGVLENLDRALAASDETQSFDRLLDGVKLIRTQFQTVLNELGLEEISVTGELFDPEVAEAISIAEAKEEAEDNRVMEVISKGYRLNGILVRPARVRVAQWKQSSSDTSGS